MWAFDVYNKKNYDGWNDPSITTFKANILKSLAREIIQNSIDARDDKNSPVVVKFKLQNFNRDMIPGLDELQQRMEHIDKYDSKNEGVSQQLDIKETLKHSKAKNLPVLIIEDENTTGLKDTDGATGYHGNSTYERFMHSSGSSGGSQKRAGSHGIGKAAPFASTPLRTIYVGSMWYEDGEPKSLYQGKTILMSTKLDPKDNNGYASMGTGFWGDDNLEPFTKINDKRFVWLERLKGGTTIAIAGFKTTADREWMPIIAGYIVADFFAAIERGTLEVQLDDPSQSFNEMIINKDTIKKENKFFKNKQIINEIEKHTSNDFPELGEAHYYHRCLTDDPSVIKFKTKLLNKYDVVLRIIVEKDAPRKICFIRENMKITEDLKHGKKNSFWATGHAPKAKIKDFVGLIEVVDKDGYELFRSMEPAQHNSLLIEEMPIQNRQIGDKAFTELSKWLKEKVEEIALEEITGSRSVSELTEYFHDDSDYDPNSSSKTTELNSNGRFVIGRKRIKNLPYVKTILIEDENAETSEITNEGNPNPNPNPTPNPNPRTKTVKPKPAPNNIDLLHQRIVKKIDSNTYTIHLNSEKIFDGTIRFIEIGLDRNAQSRIKTSSLGKINKDGSLAIKKENFKGKLKISFEVTFLSLPIGGIAVIASEDE